MRSMKEIYGDIDIKGARRIVESLDGLGLEKRSTKVMAKAGLPSTQGDFQIQRNIRGLFGKSGINQNEIGGHPDFNYLATTGDLENGHVVSLFMDIKGSTKLGITYDPETVFLIKNKIIKCVIETILAFDGHIHRIMGDAVLAFFRSPNQSPSDSAINALNCGTFIIQFMKDLVEPELISEGINEKIGVRVGIDYGKKEDVIWGMYGYTNASEVTATSFFVDVAAKLQQSSPRNRIMIGESIRNLLDLTPYVTEIKRAPEGKTDVYVEPNYSKPDGSKNNYKKYVINHETYLSLFSQLTDSQDFSVKCGFAESRRAISSADYFPCSEAIAKNQGIKFKAFCRPTIGNEKLEFKFRVENFGNDASQRPNNGNHETIVQASRQTDGTYFAAHWEDSSYLGLHVMHVSVLVNGKAVTAEKKIGIYVE